MHKENMQNDGVDVVIIGAGIGGLYAALRLSKNFRVIVLDDRTYVGGRIRTHRRPQYEIGAARFHKQHRLLYKLVRRYALTPVRIPSETEYFDTSMRQYVRGARQDFNRAMMLVLDDSRKFSKTKLQSMTFRDLCVQVLKKHKNVLSAKDMINIFGYRCEFEYLNAYDACRTFRNDFIDKQYYILQEGLSELCEQMASEIRANRGEILQNKMVTEVHRTENGLFRVKANEFEVVCTQLVFAIKPHQLKPFKILHPIANMISTVRAGKLLRIYAKFPVRSQGPWFAGMKKTTTDSVLRQIIPISESKGLILISYTDGPDVNVFLRNGKLRPDIKAFVMSECRKLFDDIPQPTYFKAHYWSEGCHFWCTNVDSDAVSRRISNPMKNIYICGEGHSLKQAWMEGALETALKITKDVSRDAKKIY